MAAADYYLTVVAGRILKLLCTEETMKYIGRLSGVHQEILKGLKETISELAPVLVDAEKKCNKGDRCFRDWTRELGEALCEVENSVDELSTEALRQSLMTSRNQMANQVCNCFLSSLITPKMHEISIWRRLEEIAAKRRDFDLEEISEKQVIVKQEKSAIFQEEDIFEHVKKEILKNLLNRDRCEENVDVLSIVSEGKTDRVMVTKKVFNDKMVQLHFELRIWVTVGEIFKVKKILTDILVRATNRTVVDDHETEGVKNLVENALEEKLYLIVLDGVQWIQDDEKWDKLRHILQVGAKGSKIIVTSPNDEVAELTAVSDKQYKLGVLTEEQSWLLFEKMAFGQDPKTSYQVEAGKKIAKRYSGQPLMVKMVASILRTENSETDWRFFYENKFPTERIIKLCYEHLPSPLKHCLAYCSLFPKYHEYDVETIIKMWMAQGFVEPLTPDQSLEEAGYDYVLDLLERGFFQVSEIDVRERVIKFHMHHELVHRLAKVVAEGSCTKLRSHNHVYGRTIHVSLDHKDCDSTLFERILVENIRSIVFPFQSLRQQDSASIQGDQIFDIIISRFIKLRTLDLHAMGINAVPSSIKKLKLLKYLDLSQNEDIRELPNSITKLLHLQTLKLSSCYGLKKLPKGFKNLINLRHLEIDGCYNLTTLPRGISQLPNLQMLSQLVVTEDTSPNIGLNKWRKELHIKNLGHENFDLNKFVNVVSEVQSLMLEWESNVRESDEHKKPLNSDLLSALEELTLRAYKGKRLFSHNCPSNLVKLSLRKCANCQILPPLHQLPNLKVLVLDELPKLEYISDNASSLGTPFFPSLKELWLTELPMLQRWWRNEEPPSFYWQTNEVDFDEWLSFDLQINDVNFDESPSFDQQTNGEDDFDEWPASFGLVINDDVDFDEWLSFDRQIRDVNVDFDEWPINDIDFDELPKLKRWWRKEVDIHPLPSFPCLSKLVVEDCPTLVSMPMFPTLEEGLALDSTCWKPFQHTMFQDTVGNKDTQESPSQSPSLPLSKLKALRIVGIEHFKADEIEWQNLKSLQFLRFDCLPNLVSLPEWLQHVLSLQELHLWRCGTEEIPEWIGELQNLSKLVIFVCPHLKSLPKAIRKLQFLETLEIEECNDLLMRCKKDIGADWKKIRFIKNLHLGQIYEK